MDFPTMYVSKTSQMAQATLDLEQHRVTDWTTWFSLSRESLNIKEEWVPILGNFYNRHIPMTTPSVDSNNHESLSSPKQKDAD
jgi:hypothetical protein